MKKGIYTTQSASEKPKKMWGSFFVEAIIGVIIATGIAVAIHKSNYGREAPPKVLPLREKIKNLFIWLMKEAVSGVVVALAVAIATLVVTELTHNRQEAEKLGVLYLGLSRPYVESVLGLPVIELTDSNLGNDTIRAYYKQRNSIVSCSYVDEHIVAYFVIVNSDKKLYKIPFNFYIDGPAYLANFTYADFSENPERAEIVEANLPGNNDDYAYYSETYHGASPAIYNYFVIGTYKNYFDEFCVPLISNALTIGDDENSFYKTAEYNSVRTRAKPNVFGMVNGEYLGSIYLVPFSEELRIYNKSLFNDW